MKTKALGDAWLSSGLNTDTTPNITPPQLAASRTDPHQQQTSTHTSPSTHSPQYSPQTPPNSSNDTTASPQSPLESCVQNTSTTPTWETAPRPHPTSSDPPNAPHHPSHQSPSTRYTAAPCATACPSAASTGAESRPRRHSQLGRGVRRGKAVFAARGSRLGIRRIGGCWRGETGWWRGRGRGRLGPRFRGRGGRWSGC